ncbi:hypothetical protein GEV02_21325 [Rugamonas sp. FT29W]|uniref:Transposase n=1 Tax=Rugamonas aquatica TaxID=2743357 RepID=A0A6A7N6N7_9BURK|nr:hypothetical protein [Rugamonas aquatica]MQA40696.1 hypothetical protein [Rugamonas aquatica]
MLRQNYNREAHKLAEQIRCYTYAKQCKRMIASLKELETVVGRVWRYVERQTAKLPATLQGKAADLRAWVKRLLTQKQRDKNKLYSLHAREAECIVKDKSRQPYECGVKVSIATTHKEGLVESPRLHRFHSRLRGWSGQSQQPGRAAGVKKCLDPNLLQVD